MAFPTTLQDLDATRGAAGQKQNNPNHITHHALEDSTIEALQAKVGIDGSAVTTSHSYKLSGVTGTDKAVSKTGTETLTNKTLTAPTLTTPTITSPALTVGDDATGDLYYRATGGFTRLPIGATDKILKVKAGIPSWETETTVENASDTVKGVVEIATTAQITAGTTTGETGARLVLPADAVGTGANDVVQLDANAKLPAVDGSQLTGVLATTLLDMVVSDNLKVSADSEETGGGSSIPALMKEIKLLRYGNIRVKFALSCSNTDTTAAHGRIYKNGVAIGTDRTENVNNRWTTHSEDFTGINRGDLIQLYTAGSNPTLPLIKEFRIYYDLSTVNDYVITNS